MCSDWHLYETVDPDSVGGLNEYNPAIAAKRVERLSDGARWMIETQRSGPNGYGWGISEVHIWIGGDIITGMIHPDLQESNAGSPTEEVVFALDQCIRLIDSLASHPGITSVRLHFNWGNHGRDTPDKRVATSWSRSYEWLLYKMLVRHYGHVGKVTGTVGRNEILYASILGLDVRMTHGDMIHYQGGVGGVTIPLLKWIYRQNETRRVPLSLFGHFHTPLDIGSAIINGSLIGFGAYSQRVGSFQRASQMCFLVDEEFGKRLSTEIFVQ
jgi:uncharacterized integral membrane protein